MERTDRTVDAGPGLGERSAAELRLDPTRVEAARRILPAGDRTGLDRLAELAGGSGGDERLTENVTLHFGKFKYSFQPQDDKGKATGGTKDFTYDMQQVKGQA